MHNPSFDTSVGDFRSYAALSDQDKCPYPTYNQTLGNEHDISCNAGNLAHLRLGSVHPSLEHPSQRMDCPSQFGA